MINMKYLILFAVFLFTNSILLSQVQGLCNGDTLYVENNTTVFVKGDFINEHSEFENHGEFSVEGNLENHAEIQTEGTGVFRLVGIQAQFVNLTGEFKTFNLDIDNALGAVFLGDENLSVFGDLDFINGIFWTRDNNLINFKQNAVYFGARDDSHISGPAIKEGDTQFRFPIGKNGVLRPMAISETNGFNIYQAEYFADLYPTLATDASLVEVSDAEYWNFDRIFGEDNPQITLVWGENSFVNQPFEDLQIGYIEDVEGWTLVESSTELPEQLETDITSLEGVTGYGFFTFATTNPTIVIQDGLVGFDLVKAGCNVRVNWNTIERLGRVSFYDIERRGPGEDFETIFSIAANNNQLTDQYTFLDTDLDNETVYHYRIVANLNDGTSSISEDKFIKSNCAPISLELYPNPVFASGILTLGINSEIEKDLEIKVVDVLGRVLQTHVLEIKRGRNSFEIGNLVHYGAAEYFIWTPDEVDIPTIEFQVIR